MTQERIECRRRARVEFKKRSTREGTVHYGVIEHERTDTGSPVFFLPGYGEWMSTITPVSNTIAERDSRGRTRKVLMIRHSRRQFRTEKVASQKFKDQYPNASPRAWRCPAPTLRRAHEAILVLDKEKTKAHLVGHSYGGMTALCIGLLRPDLVESITILNSAGLVGTSRKTPLGNQWVLFTRLAGREWWANIKKHPLKTLPVILMTLGYIFLKFSRGWAENKDAATADIVPAMRELADKGIKIKVVYDELDNVFPVDLVRKELQRLPPEQRNITTEETHEHMHYGPVINFFKYGRKIRNIVDATGR